MQTGLVRVHSDPDHGHIAITQGATVAATLCDMGPHLTLWTYRGVDLNPSAARDLAGALTAWADRHHTTNTRDADEALTEAVTRWAS
jgi:hypothetical protein